MKSKVLASSILTIVLCFSLIVGSTFALFTSEDEFDISITSGKVNLDAYASIVGVYSADGNPTGNLVDENGATYVHEAQDNYTFANGGTVALDGANLVIDRLTPGDKVVLNVNTNNKSNVAIQYRYKIAVTDGELLATGMIVTVDGVANEGLKSYTSEWFYAEPNQAILDKEIAVELPIAAGNFYQDRSVQYTVLVEAVQGNGVVANEAEVELFDLANNTVDGASAINGDFDGNHAVYSFANTTGSTNAGVTTTGGTLKNFSVIGEKMGNKGFRALYITSLTQNLNLENVDLEGTYAMNANVAAKKDNAGNIITPDYGIYAKDSTFNGWTSYGTGVKEVVFTNCSFGEAEGYANLRPYAETTLEGCDFAEGFTITRNSNVEKAFTITLNKCTVDGVAVTADNFAALLTGGDLTSEFALATSGKITVVVDGETVDWNESSTATYVKDLASLQAALDNAVAGNNTIIITNDITGDVVATQKSDVKITIEGNAYTFEGVFTVDGKSARYETAGLTIKNVNFKAVVGANACIRLGDGTNATRYTNNVTVENCTFTGEGETAAAVRSHTGGDKNLTLSGCTVNAGMHSALQVTNIEIKDADDKPLTVVDCKIYSKNGINLNNTLYLEMSGCTIDTQGYAVRFGVNGATNNGTFSIVDSTLKSANDDDDAVIIFRGNMTGATLELIDTTLTGTPEITGTANIIK